MYVTRPLSKLRNNECGHNNEAALEGPNVGVLVIDDSAPPKPVSNQRVKVTPFPQNKLYELNSSGVLLHAMLIPVLNLPSTANQYYIIKSKGTQAGLAYTSLSDKDMNECGCLGVPQKLPQIFDPTNLYQQFQIINFNKPSCDNSHYFMSSSVAPDGFPPHFLRHKRWKAYKRTLNNFDKPTQALGLDVALRARLPNLNSKQTVVVGKWYCPFIFIRDGESVSAQMKNSPYYEMTLQQNWEQIYEHGSFCGELFGHNGVKVDVSVKRQVVLVRGLASERAEVGGVMWFGTRQVGLSMAIVERVKWEQERGGFKWTENEEEVERVVRTEKFKGVGECKRFKCYILVERFVLKKMDGTVVLSWEFRHTHQIRTTWE